MKKEIQSTQLALIFQNTFTGSFEGVLSSYQDLYQNAEGQIIPIPDDFPEDSIPRLEIKLIEDNITIRLAKSRADIYFNSDSINRDVLTNFLNRTIDLGITVGRIGYVQKTIFSEINMEYIRIKLPMLNIVSVDNDILEASQRINKRTIINYNNDTLNCNNIATLTFGKPDNEPAFLLERDVNTKQDLNLALRTVDEIQQMIVPLEDELTETLYDLV